MAGKLDRVPYNIFCLKDQGYMTKIMGMGPGLFYNDDRVHSRALEDGECVQVQITGAL